MATAHQPVMRDEVIRLVDPRPGDFIVDSTAGGGGYSLAFAAKVGPQGLVLALDYDRRAVDRLNKLHQEQGLENLLMAEANFRYLEEAVKSHCPEFWGKAAGIVFDLGLSSDQLQDENLAMSFQSDGALNMNIANQGPNAYDLINFRTEKELADIFFRFGEERNSRRIARAIKEARQKKKIRTAAELARIVSFVQPPSRRLHPATRVFQALRIAVNDELGNLSAALAPAVRCLRPGGVIAVVSYHSLEDRIVKIFFRQGSRISDGPEPALRLLTKKPLVPAAAEIKNNPRARSAKLRAAIRIINTHD